MIKDSLVLLHNHTDGLTSERFMMIEANKNENRPGFRTAGAILELLKSTDAASRSLIPTVIIFRAIFDLSAYISNSGIELSADIPGFGFISKYFVSVSIC